MASARVLGASVLVLALFAQLALGWHLRGLRPAIEEFPPPPSPAELAAMALGDAQSMFRYQILWLQDFGDGGGRVKPLRDYDYDHVVGWLRAVDSLDQRSNAIYELGSHYFGALTDPGTAPAKVGRVADFFDQAAMADPGRRWPWLVWSALITQRLVKDPGLAGRIASDLMSLKDNKSVPDWLPLLAIPLFRIAGNAAEAERLSHDPAMIELRREAQESLNRQLQRR
jgi:hypothetical protein